jgi:DNA repair protein RecN (Recombination protein N)
MIEKKVVEDRTYTEITPLDEEGCERELARIMGGEPVNELAIQGAKQLLYNSRKSLDKSLV